MVDVCFIGGDHPVDSAHYNKFSINKSFYNKPGKKPAGRLNKPVDGPFLIWE
jgi:hypothetical protein